MSEQKQKKFYEVSFADVVRLLRSQAAQLKVVHNLSRLPAPLRKQVLDHIKQTELLEHKIRKYEMRFRRID